MSKIASIALHGTKLFYNNIPESQIQKTYLNLLGLNNIPASSLKINGNGGHVFGALKYAGRLPFRSGVSKSVILITCNPGTDGSFYGDAMTMLTEQVIIWNCFNLYFFEKWLNSGLIFCLFSYFNMTQFKFKF